jgi:hypothetical protein
MPVSITCGICAARHRIPDGLYDRKFRGRIVTVGCKQCGADVVVDGHRAHTSSAAPATSETGKPPVKAQGPASTRPSGDRVESLPPEAIDMDEGPTLVYESRRPEPRESVPPVEATKKRRRRRRRS